MGDCGGPLFGSYTPVYGGVSYAYPSEQWATGQSMPVVPGKTTYVPSGQYMTTPQSQTSPVYSYPETNTSNTPSEPTSPPAVEPEPAPTTPRRARSGGSG